MLGRTCKLANKFIPHQSSSISSLQSLNIRNFFDYLKVANDIDAGKSMDEITSEMQKAEDTKQADSFTWNWLKWFEENNPEKYGEYASQRSQYQRWEQYLGERGVGGGNKSINFSEYRDKISDPNFVDDLEINYFVEKDTLSSINDMSTLNTWSSSSISSFKEDCDKRGDSLVLPLTDDDRIRQQNDIENAEIYDEKMKLMSQEIAKDFEQIDAERMILGQDTMQMKLSEHPQYAETLEDIYSARQSFLDFTMLPIYNDYVKRERLATMQNEERRKQFLQRFEYASKVINGVDCTVPG